MAKYTALTPIHHDGRRYLEGDSIVLDSAAAQPLLELGAIQDARESAAERKAAAEKAEAERKAAEQAEADRAAAEAQAAANAAAASEQGGDQPT